MSVAPHMVLLTSLTATCTQETKSSARHPPSRAPVFHNEDVSTHLPSMLLLPDPTSAMSQFASSFDPRLVSRVCVSTHTPRRWRREKPQDLPDHGSPEARTAAIGLRLDGVRQETGRHTRSMRGKHVV
ncbi:hypothetical protein ZWY2020_011945 [Hordeum vulgare]|nr:hypothetical protein ZWY2020_011945 [Hordeum vulgare]